MAISRAEILKELLPGLNEIFGQEYESGWAVYVDYYYPDAEWRVGKIEKWSRAKHTESMVRILHIPEAKDELDAFVQAMNILEQPND